MIAMRRLCPAAALAAATFLGGCSDGLIRPAAPAAPAAVGIAASLNLSNGGINEAYLKVNQLSVRFLAGPEVRLEQVVPFDPNASQTVVSLQVPLNDTRESFNVQLELRTGSQALFRGSGTAQLTAGGAEAVVIPITPIVSSVTCAGPVFPIRVYQAARRIVGAALFASGDTVPGIGISWSSSDAATATVNQAGDVVGLRDGTVTITCSAQNLSGTRQVEVLATVASLQVQPVQANAVVGATTQFTAALRDSLNNAITSARTVNWTSSNPQVATVSGAGQVLAVGAGSATITATSGQASGTATIAVLSPPTATTLAATSVDSTRATLNGRVNPQGSATQVWFEYGTSPTLATVSSTPAQQAGSGTADASFSAAVTGLLPNQAYYFRIVASSPAGTIRGAILSFTPPSRPTVRTISGAATGTSATLQGGVNPNGLAAQAWFEWGTSPTLAGATSTPVQNIAAGIRTEQAVTATLNNLTPGVVYYFRAVASNTVGTVLGTIMSVILPIPPTVATLPPTPVTATQATLQATVNPNGINTTAWFEWSLGRTFTTVNSTAAQVVGSGSTAQSFSQLLGSLQPSTTYVYRVVASNAAGTSLGSDVVFTTGGPPTVTTGSATWSAVAFAVTFSGTVNPNGEATQAWFQMGIDPSFSQGTTSTTRLDVGSGNTVVNFTRGSSSPPSCLIYYRAVAQNQYGIRYGSTRSTDCAGSIG